MPKHLTIDDAPEFVAVTEVGAANGVAALGSDGKVPSAQLPAASTGAVNSVNGKVGNVVLSPSDVNAVASSAVGVANGVATLDATGKVPTAQLPTTGGGGAVTSVNTQTGDVVLTASNVGALATSSNLSDLGNASTARGNLGLGGAAVLSVGTASGTVAAGNDSRIMGALQASSNLTDLGSASTARTSLGLGNSATRTVGTATGTVAAGDDSRIVGALQASDNLSAIGNAASARGNLGLGNSATRAVGTSTGTVAAGDDSRVVGALQATNNLSELGSSSTARTNLGLGNAAVLNVGTGAGTVAAGNDLRITGALPTTTWRRRDIADFAQASALYAGTAPTITLTQSSTSTISGAVTYNPSTANFAYAGASDFQFGSGTPNSNYWYSTSRYPHTYTAGTASSSQPNWAVEFMTDAATFEVGFQYISSATTYRLHIDGHPVTDLMQTTGGSSAGSAYMLKFAVGSANVPKRIRLDFTTMPFRGVYLGPTDTLWKPVFSGGRFMVLGDSITDGSTNNTGAGVGTWLYRVGRWLGCQDIWDEARGGTGYITAGSYDTFPNRVTSDVVAYSPDRLIIWGGYNDNGGNQTSIGTAAATVFSTVASGVPNCQTTVFGCYAPTGSPTAGITNTDATLKAAAAAAGLPFVSPVTGSVYDRTGALVTTLGPWITGTGNTSATAANGIADWAIGADGVHPTDAGHLYLARRIYDSLRALMPA